MPLYKTHIPNSQTTVKIWKITESLDTLKDGLKHNKERSKRLLQMKSQIHQRGFLSIGYLLRAFGYKDTDLFYDNNGKPFLKDGKHISISHSFSFSAVAVSDNAIGIDVEKQRPKVGIIASKFIGYETHYLDTNKTDYIKKLTVIWCIKESLYKLFATPGMLFREHFLVIPFSLKDETTTAWINHNNFNYKYQSYFIQFEGFTCAYTLPY